MVPWLQKCDVGHSLVHRTEESSIVCAEASFAFGCKGTFEVSEIFQQRNPSKAHLLSGEKRIRSPCHLLESVQFVIPGEGTGSAGTCHLKLQGSGMFFNRRCREVDRDDRDWYKTGSI